MSSVRRWLKLGGIAVAAATALWGRELKRVEALATRAADRKGGVPACYGVLADVLRREGQRGTDPAAVAAALRWVETGLSVG
jgi:hypothetical protein